MKVLTPVCLIITNDASEILLVKRSDVDNFGDAWVIPGGVPEVSESYEDALARVMNQDLRCRIKQFSYFKSSYFKFSASVHYRSVYYDGKIDGDIMHSEEIAESQWFSPKQIDSLQIALDQKEVLLSFIVSKREQKPKSMWSSLFNN